MPTYPRIVEQQVRIAMRDTRVVLLNGPRQSGKTTLARNFAKAGRVFLTLDERATLAAAKADPEAFVRGLDRAVIDEVQRAPEILLAIKRSVDGDRRPGRFLLTGSANLFTLDTVNESLAGRVETIPLLPLSQSELNRRKTARFIDEVFAGRMPKPYSSKATHKVAPTLDLVCAGGYPEALTRKTERRRQDWYRAYLASIIKRDVPDIASIHKPGQIQTLLQVASQFASQLTNLSEIGRAVGLNHKTADNYLRVLEQLFLVRRIQPWSRNELSRAIKTPKLHFFDSGLLTAMRGYSMQRLRTDRTLFGPLLETFVFSELQKIADSSREFVTIYYFRDKDKNEVDFVLENASGDIVGIEVKATASVNRRDFSGLDRLASIAGTKFIQGIILYEGEHVLGFGDKLCVAPISVLWN